MRGRLSLNSSFRPRLCQATKHRLMSNYDDFVTRFLAKLLTYVSTLLRDYPQSFLRAWMGRQSTWHVRPLFVAQASGRKYQQTVVEAMRKYCVVSRTVGETVRKYCVFSQTVVEAVRKYCVLSPTVTVSFEKTILYRCLRK